MLKEWKKIANVQLKMMDILVPVIVIGTTLFLILYGSRIPEVLPTHWGFTGEIDKYSDGKSYIALIIMMYFFCGWHIFSKLLVSMIGSQSLFTKTAADKANEQDMIEGKRNIFYLLWGTDLLIVASFAYIIVCTVYVRNLGIWFLPVLILLLAFIMIYCLSRLLIMSKQIVQRA